MKYDSIIIGGGAAGSIAAIVATKLGKKVLVIEKNGRLGKKLLITGKGRCNITNNCDTNELINHVPTNARFLYSAFSQFSPQDVMDFFINLGVPLKTERGNRVFPASDKAKDIVVALEREFNKNNIHLKEQTVRELIIENGKCIGVKLENNEKVFANSVLIATGGQSYQSTGSTGDGYKFAKQAGHTIVELVPSLVPIEIVEKYCSNMMGLSLKNITLSLYEKEKCIYKELGEMLFTHFGVSGPLVLSASSHIREFKQNKFTIKIDLKPALSIEQLDKRIQRDFADATNKNFINSLHALLPTKIIPTIVKLSGIPGDLKVNQITKEQRQEFVLLLKNFSLTIKGFRPLEEAIITSGGVSVKEINPKTMESKKVSGLFFAGEVMDVDAYTGGFNLQIAFSTGYLAGLNLPYQH